MTVNDSIIHVRFGPSEVVLAGSPEEYSVRSNNPELQRIVKYFLKNPTPVKYGNKEFNTYMTGNKTFKQLFLSVVSAIPGQAFIVKAPDGLAERFWDEEKIETPYWENDNGINY